MNDRRDNENRSSGRRFVPVIGEDSSQPRLPGVCHDCNRRQRIIDSLIDELCVLCAVRRTLRRELLCAEVGVVILVVAIALILVSTAGCSRINARVTWPRGVVADTPLWCVSMDGQPREMGPPDANGVRTLVVHTNWSGRMILDPDGVNVFVDVDHADDGDGGLHHWRLTRSMTTLCGSVTTLSDGMPIVGRTLTIEGVSESGEPVSVTSTTDAEGNYCLVIPSHTHVEYFVVK